jgi:hypothetical protein
MSASSPLQDEMLSQELQLLHSDHRADPPALERLLAAGFVEVNPAGGRSSRAEVVQWLLQKEPAARWQLQDLEVQSLADGVRLVTYHALQVAPQRSSSKGARHVSLWCFSPVQHCWQLQFHQSSKVL